MQFVSTRAAAAAGERLSLSEALQRGLALDGGLYVPTRLPRMRPEDFEGCERIADIGARLLRPFFAGDALEDQLEAICESAFDFEVPLVELGRDSWVLELFHGPTAAFKDIGARFLAECLSRSQAGAKAPLTILVATSGDTGSAVAAAFWRKPQTEVVVLYPDGRVSPRQEHQLTCWDDNVASFAIAGHFDDCQRLVKAALMDPWWRANKRLSSANSINIGRLLPQMVYYAASSLWIWRQTRRAPRIIVPSGNVGNALAGLWAKRAGLPIREIVLATNANRPVVDYMSTGAWQPRATIETIANAMDVGSPSNMERLRDLYGDDVALMHRDLRAASVDDASIRARIKAGPQDWGQVWCPHTACAVEIRERHEGEPGPWVMVATAHPAKFEAIVEPLIGRSVELPAALSALLHRPTRRRRLAPDLEALREAVSGSSRRA